MTRHAAFLRGINLGKRRVKMDRLRAEFQALGFGNVRTFIASGNVVFDHPGSELGRLEREIESHLEGALGFAVETFVRSLAGLDRLTELEMFRTEEEKGFTPHVIFLRDEADPQVKEALGRLETADDHFHVLLTEAVWFRRGGLSSTSIQTRELEKALGGRGNTTRNLNTLRRIVERFRE